MPGLANLAVVQLEIGFGGNKRQLLLEVFKLSYLRVIRVPVNSDRHLGLTFDLQLLLEGVQGNLIPVLDLFVGLLLVVGEVARNYISVVAKVDRRVFVFWPKPTFH